MGSELEHSSTADTNLTSMLPPKAEAEGIAKWMSVNPMLGAAIITAGIGGIFAIMVALIPYMFAPPIPTLIPSPTATVTATITDTATATQASTFTPTLPISPTAADAPAASETPSITIEPSPGTRVFVVLVANRNTGKPPLNIRLDARDSYLLEPNGTRLSCRGGPCFYTWSVYSGGQQIGRAENNSIGTFDYTFGKNGTYTVTIVVCRGRDKIDCAGSGTQIVVSR